MIHIYLPANLFVCSFYGVITVILWGMKFVAKAVSSNLLKN